MPQDPFAVAGSPPIGVKVQGTSIAGWTLSYGEGEFPTTWVDFYNGNGERTFSANSYGELTGGGITPLDTDAPPFVNGRLYKLRLQATNGAAMTFTTYALFRPARARITFPSKNHVIVPSRGWLPLVGYAHVRAGKLRRSGAARRWKRPMAQHADDESLLRLPDHVRLFVLMHSAQSGFEPSPHSYCGFFPAASTGPVPAFPSPVPILSDGFIEYVLRVGSDSDVLRLSVDASNYPTTQLNLLNDAVSINTVYGPDIPDFSQFPICFHNYGRQRDRLIVLPVDANVPVRVLVNHIFGLSALDASGSLVWQLTSDQVYGDVWGIFVGNVDADAAMEIIADTRILDGRTGQVKYMLALPDEGAVAGITFANVAGDSRNELVIKRQVWDRDNSTLHGRLTVYSVGGPAPWSRDFAAEDLGDIRTADIDGDGLQEILVGGTGQILRGNNTFLPNWSTEGHFQQADFARTGASTFVILGDGSSVTAKTVAGTTRVGPWRGAPLRSRSRPRPIPATPSSCTRMHSGPSPFRMEQFGRVVPPRP